MPKGNYCDDFSSLVQLGSKPHISIKPGGESNKPFQNKHMGCNNSLSCTIISVSSKLLSNFLYKIDLKHAFNLNLLVDAQIYLRIERNFTLFIIRKLKYYIGCL